MVFQKVNVKYKKLHPLAKEPFYGSQESAGFDIYSVEDVEIPPKSLKIIHTGISLEIEEGYCWQVWGRSSFGSKGIDVFGGLGDSDYRGEFKIMLYNSNESVFKISIGDRIAQIVPVPIVRAIFEEKNELSISERGSGGFGSTGVN